MSMLHFLKSRLPSMVIAELLEKGKRAQIGEVRDWDGQKWRKVSEKKWMPVRDAHKTGEFHGDEHEDIKRVHEASGYRDTKGSTVAGLRYMINREGSTATVRVVHSASGKVLAEGYAGSYGTTNHIYDHLNHVLGSFNWKQSMDNLRTEIGKNDAMRESVKHVLENTDKWKSAKTAVGLKGAGKVSKHAPKKYLAVSKTEPTPQAEEKVAEKEPEPVAEKKADEVVKAEPKTEKTKKPKSDPTEETEVHAMDKITHLDGATITGQRGGQPFFARIKKKTDGTYEVAVTMGADANAQTEVGEYKSAMAVKMMLDSTQQNAGVVLNSVVNGKNDSVDEGIQKYIANELQNEIAESMRARQVVNRSLNDADIAEIAHEIARDDLGMSSKLRQKLMSKHFKKMGFSSTAKKPSDKFYDMFKQYVLKHAKPAMIKRAKQIQQVRNTSTSTEIARAHLPSATEKAKQAELASTISHANSIVKNDNHAISARDIAALSAAAQASDNKTDHPVYALLRNYDTADLNTLAQAVGLTAGKVTIGHLTDLREATRTHSNSSDDLRDHLDDIKKKYKSCLTHGIHRHLE